MTGKRVRSEPIICYRLRVFFFGDFHIINDEQTPCQSLEFQTEIMIVLCTICSYDNQEVKNKKESLPTCDTEPLI